jgi:hypothetical protein
MTVINTFFVAVASFFLWHWQSLASWFLAHFYLRGFLEQLFFYASVVVGVITLIAIMNGISK